VVGRAGEASEGVECAVADDVCASTWPVAESDTIRALPVRGDGRAARGQRADAARSRDGVRGGGRDGRLVARRSLPRSAKRVFGCDDVEGAAALSIDEARG
jgi:hypothetical protein